MTDEERDECDADDTRAREVLVTALELADKAYVPAEIIFLVGLLYERLDPKDAVVVGYLLGRCNGDVEALKKLAAEWGSRQAASPPQSPASGSEVP